MKTNKEKVDYSNIRIASVKLVNDGMKGCVVKYEKVEVIEGREFRNEYNPKMKHPVHGEMLKCFGWLKKHLLLMCGYDVPVGAEEGLLRNLEMTGVSCGDGGFVLSGKLEVYDNGKVVSLNTPYTSSEEEYVQYEDVLKIIEGIYEETKNYLGKTVVMDDKQLVMKFHRGDDKFDEASFLALPEREQKKIATQVLEKMKCIVIHEGDLDMSHIDAVVDSGNGLKEEKQVEEIVESDVIVAEDDVFELEEDDDFGLEMEEVPVPEMSTAKKR